MCSTISLLPVLGPHFHSGRVGETDLPNSDKHQVPSSLAENCWNRLVFSEQRMVFTPLPRTDLLFHTHSGYILLQFCERVHFLCICKWMTGYFVTKTGSNIPFSCKSSRFYMEIRLGWQPREMSPHYELAVQVFTPSLSDGYQSVPSSRALIGQVGVHIEFCAQSRAVLNGEEGRGDYIPTFQLIKYVFCYIQN